MQKEKLINILKKNIKNASWGNIANAADEILIREKDELINAISSFGYNTENPNYEKRSFEGDQRTGMLSGGVTISEGNNQELINAIASLILGSINKDEILADNIKSQLVAIIRKDFGEPYHSIFKIKSALIFQKNDTESVREKARQIIDLFNQCFNDNDAQMKREVTPTLEDFKKEKEKISCNIAHQLNDFAVKYNCSVKDISITLIDNRVIRSLIQTDI